MPTHIFLSIYPFNTSHFSGYWLSIVRTIIITMYYTGVYFLKYFTQIVTCDAVATSEHSESFDPFTILTACIPPKMKICTVYNCLDIMISDEIIEGWKG